MKTSRKIELVVIYLLWYVSHLSRENKPTLKEFIKTDNGGKSITVGDLVKLGIPILLLLSAFVDVYFVGFDFDKSTYNNIVFAFFLAVIFISFIIYVAHLLFMFYEYIKKNWNKEVKLK